MIDHARGTILVVEDEPILRMVLVEQLFDLGYDAIEAGDADTALAVLAGDEPLTLLITDVELPGMDGRALAGEAARLRPALGILFSTGDAGAIRNWRGFDAARMAAIGKPFALAELSLAIGALMAKPVDVAP